MKNPYPIYRPQPVPQNMNFRNQKTFVSPNAQQQYHPSPVKPQSISFQNKIQ